MSDAPEWLSRDPPPWQDDALSDEVADWVADEMEAIDLELERQFYTLRWDLHPGIPMSEIVAGVERDAVEAAKKRNNFRPLLELFALHLNVPAGKKRAHQLSADTKKLAMAILTGQKKRAKEDGRPQMSPDERRAANPIHDLAQEVMRVELILKDAYPKKSEELIRDQAARAVARRWMRDVREFGRPFDPMEVRRWLRDWYGFEVDPWRWAEWFDLFKKKAREQRLSPEEMMAESLKRAAHRAPTDHRNPGNHPKSKTP